MGLSLKPIQPSTLTNSSTKQIYRTRRRENASRSFLLQPKTLGWSPPHTSLRAHAANVPPKKEQKSLPAGMGIPYRLQRRPQQRRISLQLSGKHGTSQNSS